MKTILRYLRIYASLCVIGLLLIGACVAYISGHKESEESFKNAIEEFN
jgi:CHASE3 domain sensor protein